MLKLPEVLALPAVLSGDLWIRPAGSLGSGYAIKNGSCCLVPSPDGGRPYMTFSVKYLAGDWEAVTPSQVRFIPTRVGNTTGLVVMMR